MSKWVQIGGTFAAVFLALGVAQAATGKVAWESRHSEVVCGGEADGQELEFRTVPGEKILSADSADHRVLLYLDLHKEGRVRIVSAELLTDDDYESRQAIIAKLEDKDAKLIQRLSANRFNEMFVGLTDGLLDSRTSMGGKLLKFSCQEMPTGPADR